MFRRLNLESSQAGSPASVAFLYFADVRTLTRLLTYVVILNSNSRYGFGNEPLTASSGLTGKFLYDGANLPAGPFFFSCKDGDAKCTQVPFGQYPAGVAPSPSPPAPPAPPPSEDTTICSYQNCTTYNDRTYSKSYITRNNFTQCCELCKADAKCKVAFAYHGPKDAPSDFCELKASASQPVKLNSSECTPPMVSLTCVPKPEPSL